MTDLNFFADLVSCVCSPTESQVARERAQAKLNELITVANIPHFTRMVEEAQAPELALSQAMGALSQLVTQHWDRIDTTTALALIDVSMNFLKSKGPTSPNFLRAAATRLVCRTAKKGWFRSALFRRTHNAAITLLSLPKDTSNEKKMMTGNDLNDNAVNNETYSALTERNVEANVQNPAKWGGRLVALELLRELVLELDNPCIGETEVQHRKLAVSVRGTTLLQIFRSALKSVKELYELGEVAKSAAGLDDSGLGGTSFAAGLAAAEGAWRVAGAMDSASNGGDIVGPGGLRVSERICLLTKSLQLASACLNFDFSGINPESERSIMSALAVPASWIACISADTARLLFAVFHSAAVMGEDGNSRRKTSGTDAPTFAAKSRTGISGEGASCALETAAAALECAALLASTRRLAVLNPTDFLKTLLSSIYAILCKKHGLSDVTVAHHLCQLLSRLKSTFKLAELAAADGYEKWLALLTQYTATSLVNWQWAAAANCVTYLMEFWAMVVGATRSTDDPKVKKRVGECAKLVCRAYIDGRVQALALVEDEGDVAELDEEGEPQMHLLPLVSRFWYPSVGNYMCSLIDVRLAELQKMMIAQGNDVKMGKRIACECQLFWLVRAAASFMGAQLPKANRKARSLNRMMGSLPNKGVPVLLAANRFNALQTKEDGLMKMREEEMDAEISRRIISLAKFLHDTLQASNGTLKSTSELELAVVGFMAAMRSSYFKEEMGMPPAGATDAENNNTGNDKMDSSMVDSLDMSKASQGMDAKHGKSGKVGITHLSAPPLFQYSMVGQRQREAMEKRSSFDLFFSRMALGSHVDVLEIIVSHINTNLRFRGDDASVIKSSVDLLHTLVHDLSLGRLLLGLSPIKFLLRNDNAKHFPFLNSISTSNKSGNLSVDGKKGTGRYRSTFYLSLSRLLWLQDGPAMFATFVSPFRKLLLDLSKCPDLREANAKRALIGLCYDLRGIIGGSFNRRTYNMAFGELFLTDGHLGDGDAGLKCLTRAAAELWNTGSDTMSPILHLLVELTAETRNRRLSPDHNPNGVILFRTVSNFAAAYLPNIVMSNPPGDIWKNKLKGINLCLVVCNAALSASWVNFSLFALYNDPALQQLLEIVVTVTLTLSPNAVLEYGKLAGTFYHSIRVLLENHMVQLLRLPSKRFHKLLDILVLGLSSPLSDVSSNAGSAIEAFAAFAFSEGLKKNETTALLQVHITARPSIWKDLTKLLLEIVLFTETLASSAMARPIFALLLVAPAAFEEVKLELINSQKEELKPQLVSAFNTLDHPDLRPNLEAFNMKLFTRLLIAFRHDVLGFLQL